MVKIPSLVSLCMEALKTELIGGDDLVADIYELPSDLFDILLTHLPPLALQKLQAEMPYKDWSDFETNHDCFNDGRKRGRCGNFNAAWKKLFRMRWPLLIDQIQPDDWQQIYWETHLQNCLDEAAEFALRPSFAGLIGDIQISDSVLKHIGCKEHMNCSACEYSKLSYHCQQFGCFARCLRLQSVLCVIETCQLLRNSKLQSLVLRWIRSAKHVEGLCKLLIQNSESLTSLELLHCNLSSSFLNGVRSSLSNKSGQTHRIQHFSIKTSSFIENNPTATSLGLVSFLVSGRSLHSLKFCGNHLDNNFGRMVFSALCDASSSLSVLDLSENSISGWLSMSNWRSVGPLSSISVEKSLKSLRVLNLRGNNLRKDDMGDLKYSLVLMPNLETLDISDNPIGDDGIRSLIPYFTEVSGRCNPMSKLNVENCELCSDGVSQLLGTLSVMRRPLNSLCVADNNLGSQVAAALAKFLSSSIQELNIGGIGLGLSGFRELQEGLADDLKLVNVNISKNRGGIETAKFLSKLMLCAPQLTAVNASYNLMPLESLTIICSTLKVAKGHVECLDLTGNNWDYQPSQVSKLDEFQRNGRPILIFPSLQTNVPYDDDP